MSDYTIQQILDAQEFHINGGCHRTIGPRGGVTIKTTVYRRNGATKLWKTRPTEFRIPVKRGLRDYDYVDDGNMHKVHLIEDCPAQA